MLIFFPSMESCGEKKEHFWPSVLKFGKFHEGQQITSRRGIQGKEGKKTGRPNDG